MASGELRHTGGTGSETATAGPSAATVRHAPDRALAGRLDPAVRRVEAPPDLRLPSPWSATPLAVAGAAVPAEVALVARWMAAPHVERFWHQAWPAERWAGEVRTQQAGAHSRPWLVALDGEPVAYVEVYRVARDVIAAHHPVAPHDLGVHIAIGDPARTGRGLGPRLLAAVSDSLLAADPRCGRVLSDPDVDHDVARRAFARAGFVPVREVALPHKRAALMARGRLPAGSTGELPAGTAAGLAGADAPGAPAGGPGREERAVTARLAGLGAVTGYGWGVEALEAGIAARASALAPARVDGVDAVAAVVPDRKAEPGSHDDRYEQAIMAAVDEAVADAGAHGWRAGAVVGVIVGTGIADIRTVRDNYFSGRRPLPSLFPRMLHTSTGSLIAQRHGWTGPNMVVNAACSSSNIALAMAEQWVRAGTATDVVVVGAEFCLVEQIITGFRRMRVLPGDGRPATDCRPFQEGSRGFFLGEAAVACVVTPRADGGRATVLGGATTHDAHHLVAAEPEGRELERCVREALGAAGVAAHDVGVLKAHGSGTPLNDGVEAALADRLFPDSTVLCSYKPLVGHCMAAAGLAEVAGLLASYRVGALPGHVTDDPAHPRLPDGGPPPDGLALCASVGLGGANAAVVLDVERPPA